MLERGFVPNVVLVQVALGRCDAALPVWYVEPAVLGAVAAMDASQRESYEWHMSYLRNMSCVGRISSHLASSCREMVNTGAQVSLRRETVPVWCWSRLVRETSFHALTPKVVMLRFCVPWLNTAGIGGMSCHG